MKNRMMPYFQFFMVYGRYFFLTMAAFLFITEGMIIIIETTKYIQGVLVEKDSLVFSSLSTGSFLGICFVYGIVCTYLEFSRAISIRGDRKGYLRTLLIWIVCISILAPLVNLGADYIVKCVLQMITGYEVMVISELKRTLLSESSQLPYFLGMISVVGGMFLDFMTTLSVGCAIGALAYRLRIMTGIILLIVVPTIFGITMNKFSNFALSCMGNPLIMLGIKCLTILLCLGLTVGLLIKAPIKEYAHDLL